MNASADGSVEGPVSGPASEEVGGDERAVAPANSSHASERHALDTLPVTSALESRDPDPRALRATLEAFEPHDPKQRALRAEFLRFLAAHPEDGHERRLTPGHFTVSVLLLDAPGERALLMHHRRHDAWQQLGGHLDGDANAIGVALREVREESGLRPVAISARPIELERFDVPARGAEPAHHHFDLRYLAWAAPGARATGNDESHALHWCDWEAAESRDVDESLRRLLLLGFSASPPSR